MHRIVSAGSRTRLVNRLGPQTQNRAAHSASGHTKQEFAHSRVGSFFQEPPTLKNQFEDDQLLQTYLARSLPASVYSEIKADLHRFGQRVVDDLLPRANLLEKNPPVLQNFDAWGNRIDRLILSDEWRYMHNVSAEEGLISIGYERKYGQYSRLYQYTKLYLFNQSSGLYSCPLAMTDGAARVLETLPQNYERSETRQAYKRLTSTDADQFWTSGQWMTERAGGSDVSRATATLAHPHPTGSHRLFGYKWFTSATDSEMALTLAREVDESGVPNSGLSLFYLPTQHPHGKGGLNGIQIQRLKSKLGTRQLPTAELLLEGTEALRISDTGRGVAAISKMLTITRLHNTLTAAATLGRVLALARDYARRRAAFGKHLTHHPLHVQALARLEVERRGAFLLTMDLVTLLGVTETGHSSPQQQEVLRLMTPVAKLFTAKQAVAGASEGLEAFGGQGYMEDTMIPVIFRDSQVLPIWEGTTNILSLDVLRSIIKSKGEGLKAFKAAIEEKVRTPSSGGSLNDGGRLKTAADSVLSATKELLGKAQTLFGQNQDTQAVEAAARDLSMSIGRIYVGALLVEDALIGASSSSPSASASAEAAIWWCSRSPVPLVLLKSIDDYSATARSAEDLLAFGQ